MTDVEWFLESDAVDIASAVRSRTVSATEVVDAALNRIEETNETLNACCLVLVEEARAAARSADRALAAGSPAGSLHGVPVVIKDAIWMRGVPATMGSRALTDFVPGEDAVVVQRLRGAGAIVVAKSANPEFLWSHQVEALHGITRNPWCLSRTSSGSSGGSAAAVAAGMAPLALGSDAGGSIRSPAAVCGLVGHKPTHGLIPRTPGFEEMRTVNVFGPLTRTVRDSALALSVLAGPDLSDDLSLEVPPADFVGALSAGITDLRIAWSPDARDLDTADASVRAVVDAAIDRFAAAGWQLDAVSPEKADLTALASPILTGELSAPVEGREHLLAAPSRELLEASRRLSANDYYAAQLERARFTWAWDRLFEHHDVILMPALPFVAPKIGAAGVYGALKAIGPVAIANLTKRPATSVPIGLTSDGLPIALEIMGRRGSDSTCLAVAAAVERLAPWPRLAPLARGKAR